MKFFAVLTNRKELKYGKVKYGAQTQVFTRDDQEFKTYQKAVRRADELNGKALNLKFKGHEAVWLAYYSR